MKTFCISLMVIVVAATSAIAQDLASSAGQDVSVIMKGNLFLKGTLLNLNSFNLTTNFGEAKIPAGEIDGIRLHADEQDACVVAFKNGDIVTGTLNLVKLSIETSWGDANIRADSIESILLNTKGRFYKDTSSGKARWRFSDSTSSRTNVVPGTRPNGSFVPQGSNNNFVPQIRNTQPPSNRVVPTGSVSSGG